MNKEIILAGEKYELVVLGQYQDGTKAIGIADSDGLPYGRLTVYIPGTKLEEGEYLVKTWSENEIITGLLLQEGIFVDTGKRIPSNFVEAQIWKLK